MTRSRRGSPVAGRYGLIPWSTNRGLPWQTPSIQRSMAFLVYGVMAERDAHVVAWRHSCRDASAR